MPTLRSALPSGPVPNALRSGDAPGPRQRRARRFLHHRVHQPGKPPAPWRYEKFIDGELYHRSHHTGLDRFDFPRVSPTISPSHLSPSFPSVSLFSSPPPLSLFLSLFVPSYPSFLSTLLSQGPKGYLLSLGALTGAGMFVGTVVAGSVMVAAGGVKARGALIRDVCA